MARREIPRIPVKMFLEIESTEEANQVNMRDYRLERWSETRGAWLFVRRGGR